jgi:hypothetical protein
LEDKLLKPSTPSAEIKKAVEAATTSRKTFLESKTCRVMKKY